MSTEQAKQRLMAIDVGEVSLVGHPANEEPFVVTKAKVMTNLDPNVAMFVTMDAIRDTLYCLTDKLRDPSKFSEAKNEFERIKAMMESAEQFISEVNKAMGPIVGEIKKAKEGNGKKMPPWMKEATTKVVDALKAMMDEPDDDDAKTTKAIEGVSQAMVLKVGQPQLSKERLSKLHEAFKHIGGMLKASNYDDFQKSLDEWTAKPATSQSGGQAASGGGGATGPNTDAPKGATTESGSVNKSTDAPPVWLADVTKGMAAAASAAAEAAKAAAETANAMTQVTKRVEAIERTEAVSKALPNGNNDGKPVEKENFWKGVLS